MLGMQATPIVSYPPSLSASTKCSTAAIGDNFLPTLSDWIELHRRVLWLDTNQKEKFGELLQKSAERAEQTEKEQMQQPSSTGVRQDKGKNWQDSEYQDFIYGQLTDVPQHQRDLAGGRGEEQGESWQGLEVWHTEYNDSQFTDVLRRTMNAMQLETWSCHWQLR